MNKLRRKELLDVIKELKAVQEKEDIYAVINTLEYIRDDEENYYDNIPENLQSSNRAYDSERAIDCMNEALALLETAYASNEDASKTILKAIDKINESRY